MVCSVVGHGREATHSCTEFGDRGRVGFSSGVCSAVVGRSNTASEASALPHAFSVEFVFCDIMFCCVVFCCVVFCCGVSCECCVLDNTVACGTLVSIETLRGTMIISLLDRGDVVSLERVNKASLSSSSDTLPSSDTRVL